MPYLGNIPATQFAELKYQDFTGGTGTSFTLNDPVGTAQELEVFVNNVRQEPGVAYTVSGTALTMTGSIASTDDFYVVFQGKSTGTATHPAGQALTATDGTFTGDLTVDTNTLKVDSTNNRVGVGVAAPDVHLHVQNDTNPRFRVEDTTNNVKFDVLAQNSDVKMGNNSNHDLRIITNNSERLRVLAGGGLTFNGDTAAANALDDYEEGTFTPTLSSSFYAGTLTINGYYTKIGDIVYVRGILHINSYGDGNGGKIDGFPFAASGESAFSIAKISGIQTAVVDISFRIAGSSGYFMHRTAASTGETTNPSQMAASGAYLSFAGTYKV